MMDIGLFKVDEKMTQCLRSELVHVLITADLVRKELKMYVWVGMGSLS